MHSKPAHEDLERNIQGVKLRKTDRTNGWIRPCMAYPLENLGISI